MVAAVAALVVLPLRSRLQRLVDRVMYGDRADPYAALTRLATRSHAAPTSTEVLAAVAGSIAASLRVPWVRVSAFGASVEHGRPTGTSVTEVPLLSRDTVVGTIEASARPGRHLAPAEHGLLQELGRHAGITIDAVRLAEEASRHQRGLVAAREEERRRLGRELHDELGPAVAGLAMQLGALRDLVRTDPDVVADRLDVLHATAAQALADIRHVAHDLRPTVLDQLGLEGAVRRVGESLGLHTTVVVEMPPPPAVVELAAYRICAEALTNVARHAGSPAARVELVASDDELVLTVDDEGRGLVGANGVGLGLESMRERADELEDGWSSCRGRSRGRECRPCSPCR